MNALVACCAKFAAGKISRDRNGQRFAVYQRSINPRVHGIISSNYDPFLEAASSTMFRIPILKPVAAQGSSTGDLTQIPVFHIHGYVPLPGELQGSTSHIPMVGPVITTSDYKSAWKVNDAYNFTMGPQIHILRNYSVLFIGFSFRDEWVNDLLRTLNKERKKREMKAEKQVEKEGNKRKERALRLYHYAIMKEDKIKSKGYDFFDELGVKAIPVRDYAQIKDLLGHLYQQGLAHDYQGRTRIKLPLYEGKKKDARDKPVCLSPEGYFEELFNCRLSMVRNNKSSALAYPIPGMQKKNRNI